jgi:hypothetical protein
MIPIQTLANSYSSDKVDSPEKSNIKGKLIKKYLN